MVCLMSLRRGSQAVVLRRIVLFGRAYRRRSACRRTNSAAMGLGPYMPQISINSNQMLSIAGACSPRWLPKTEVVCGDHQICHAAPAREDLQAAA